MAEGLLLLGNDDVVVGWWWWWAGWLLSMAMGGDGGGSLNGVLKQGSEKGRKSLRPFGKGNEKSRNSLWVWDGIKCGGCRFLPPSSTVPPVVWSFLSLLHSGEKLDNNQILWNVLCRGCEC